jgi:tetratricopeptide (TPR) repeat protein
MKRLAPDEKAALAADLGEAAALVALAERPADRADGERTAAAKRSLAWYAAAVGCFRGRPVPSAVHDGQAAAARLAGEPVPTVEGQVDDVSPRAAFLRGTLLRSEGRVVDAVAQFEKVTRDCPDHFAGQYLLGVCLYETFEPVRALERLEMAKALAPTDYRPIYFRSAALLQSGREAEAEQELAAAIAIAPTVADLYYHRARVRFCSKPADALADLARAVELGGLTPAILHTRSAVHKRLADSATDPDIKAHHSALAESDKDTILRSIPKTALDYAIRGFNLYDVNPAASLAAYRSATELNPRDFLSWYNQASVLTKKLKNPDEAIRALDKSVETNPQFANAILNRAQMHARLGHRDEAIADAERGLKICNLPASLVYTAACVYAITSKTEPKDADIAMSLFKRAAREGFHNTRKKYAADEDLAQFKDRPDFQKLVNSINTIVQ